MKSCVLGSSTQACDLESCLLTNIKRLNICHACNLMILDSIAKSDSFLNIALFKDSFQSSPSIMHFSYDKVENSWIVSVKIMKIGPSVLDKQ